MLPSDPFDALSRLDYRYWDEEAAKYLSESASIWYKLKVELALIKVLCRRQICSENVLQEIEAACSQITPAEVYEEEAIIKHDIRALVNCIRKRVSDESKPYIHWLATSYDIIESANMARYRDMMQDVVLSSLIQLEKVIISLTLQEAETSQVGRTHGQHAVPLTFGFALAEYVNRLGGCIEALQDLTLKLRGKFSGAVGAYNAAALFFDNPEEFEAEVLAELGLMPAECSTQIAPPEALARLLSEMVTTAGVLANLADDMRHLQRTEILEVGEVFKSDTQVGSSTMPHKQNPINFENVKSTWKIVVGRMVTVFLDQISEHQRDLTNSASSGTYGEIFCYVTSMVKRTTKAMSTLQVHRNNMRRNMGLQGDLILTEALNQILAGWGHPDAHEKGRVLALQAQKEGRSVFQLITEDPEMQPYKEKMTFEQYNALSIPSMYRGISSQKAIKIANTWKQRLGI